MNIYVIIKEWLFKKLLKLLNKEIAQLEEELRAQFEMKFKDAKADNQLIVDKLIKKKNELFSSLLQKEEESKVASDKVNKLETELKKYLISDTLQQTVNHVVREVEKKFLHESGEFKRAQVLRSVMNIHSNAPERDIGYAIEKAVREFQK